MGRAEPCCQIRIESMAFQLGGRENLGEKKKKKKERKGNLVGAELRSTARWILEGREGVDSIRDTGGERKKEKET